MTNAILQGKPDAGNPHVRTDEGEVASVRPRRGSLLYTTSSKLYVNICATAIVSAFCAWGDTLTWKGGASGLLSDSANWTSDGSHASPQSGDTLVFNKDVELSAETFDIGANGLTIRNSNDLKIKTSLSGSGGIVKYGAGAVDIYDTTSYTFTGGTVFREGGPIRPTSGWKGVAFGTGAVTFDYATDGKRVFRNSWDGSLNNAVVLQGADGSRHGMFDFQGSGSIGGKVTSDGDFSIYYFKSGSSVGDVNFNGGISAPGHTVDFTCETWGNTARFVLAGEIDASLSLNAPNFTVTLKGSSPTTENSLNVTDGTMVIASTGYWGGREITVGSRLKLEGEQNLSEEAVVRVSSSGKLELAAACSVTVGALYVDGNIQPQGRYTKSELPDVIEGDGSILVAPVKAWKSSVAEGLWSDDANWEGGAAPVPGDAVRFPADVVLQHETVDLGEAGFTVTSDHKITLHTTFTGAGGIVKNGSGIVELMSDAGGSFAGGVTFNGGRLHLCNAGEGALTAFGTGAITFTEDININGYYYIQCTEWDAALSNPLVFSGKNTSSGQNDGAIAFPRPGRITGTITSSYDFMFSENYYVCNPHVTGAISAPGKTLTVRSLPWWNDAEFYLDGPVNASLKASQGAHVYLAAVSPCTNEMLTVNAQNASVEFESAAEWHGRTLVVGSDDREEGATAILRVRSNANLVEGVDITIKGGGSLDIASGVKVKAKSLVVNGTALPIGIYAKGSLPGVLTGEGRIRVGTPGALLVVR